MAAKETLDEAAAALDAIEEKLDILETPIAEIIEMKRNYGNIAALVLGGALVGSAITYFVTKKVVEKQAEARFDVELEKSMTFLVDRIVEGKMIVKNDPDDVDDDSAEFDEAQKPVIAELPPEEVPEVGGTRVLTSAVEREEAQKANQATNYNGISTPESFTDGPEENLEPEEDVYHDPDISVISRDLFMENPTGWPQETVVYFADKVVLVNGDYLPDPEDKIGAAKPAFGQMSDDANCVYLRNKRLQLEFEVIWDEGNGADFANPPEEGDELKHSIQSLADRFRPEHQRE